MVNVKKVAIFVGGMLFGSAGFKILASKDAKKVYTQTTAAVLRMKDCTMETVSRVQEEAGDIDMEQRRICPYCMQELEAGEEQCPDS